MSNNNFEWTIKDKVGYSLVMGDPEGHVCIVTHDGRKLTQPITEQEAKNILSGESSGFGKWLMSEDLLGKEIKPNPHGGLIVGSYPAGWNHPEELFIVSLSNGNTSYMTRSEFELLQ